MLASRRAMVPVLRWFLAGATGASLLPAQAPDSPSLRVYGGRAAEEWAQRLSGDSEPERVLARQALRELGPAAIGATAVLSGLLDHADARVRLAAVEVLGSIGIRHDAALPPLLAALEDEDATVQADALAALGLMRARAAAAAPTIAGFLRSTNTRHRYLAANALDEIGRVDEAVPALRALLGDPDAGVREAAAYALDSASPSYRREIIAALLPLLIDSDADVVYAVVSTLGDIGRASPELAVPALLGVVESDRSEGIREQAIASLGALRRDASAAVPVLVRIISEHDGDLRVAAAKALGTISGPAPHGPAVCLHHVDRSRRPASFSIDAGSGSLRGDGKGSYEDRRDGQINHQTAFNLFLGGENSGHPRTLEFDLTQPVAGSGSVSRGLVKDPAARFHIFYLFDQNRAIWNLREMLVGPTVLSPRTEMHVALDGKPHILQLGPWGIGDCNEAYAEGGRVHGEGTTQVHLTRQSDESYSIVAPPGSIARLWDWSTPSAPVDRGLYFFHFRASVRTRID